MNGIHYQICHEYKHEVAEYHELGIKKRKCNNAHQMGMWCEKLKAKRAKLARHIANCETCKNNGLSAKSWED